MPGGALLACQAQDRLTARAEEMAASELKDCTFNPQLTSRRRPRVRVILKMRRDSRAQSTECSEHEPTDSHCSQAHKRFEELYTDGRTREERLLGKAEAAMVAEREREVR